MNERLGKNNYLHGLKKEIKTYDDLNNHIKKQRELETGGVPDPKEFLKVGADVKHEKNNTPGKSC
jgi:hypothetical protein